ncbi:MAG: tetraacyldisaccharide 4'-kinase [Sphingobacteriales bacterium]
MILLKIFLFPFSLLFAFYVRVRHWLYKIGYYTPYKYEKPVIGIGNLSLGGSGKTPMTELVLEVLKNSKNAVLSRGYGRKTKGFRYVEQTDNYQLCGDEPLQIKRKFPKATVAVSEDRNFGINVLKYNHDIFILDDCLQHLKIEPGLKILLTTYSKPFSEDFLFPFGTLRDVKSAKKRADVVVVTKTPEIFSPLERKRLAENLDLAEEQKLFFAFTKYGSLKNFSGQTYSLDSKNTQAISFAGIANHQGFVIHCTDICTHKNHLGFKDHHDYSLGDIQKVITEWKKLTKKDKIIITTEKDAVKLQNEKFSNLLEGIPIYYQEIKMQMHKEDEKAFEELIINYARPN